MYQRRLTFAEAIRSVLIEKYCCFSGRAARSELWFYALFTLILNTGLSIYTGIIGETAANTVSSVLGILFLLPSLGVQARRLHDTGKTAWLLMLHLLCGIGSLILLFIYLQPSENFANEYGPVPNLEGGNNDKFYNPGNSGSTPPPFTGFNTDIYR